MSQAAEPTSVDAASLRDFVAGHLGVPGDDLAPDALLLEDLGLDSLTVLELGMALEERYGVTLDDATLGGIHSYGDLVRAVLAGTGGTAAG